MKAFFVFLSLLISGLSAQGAKREFLEIFRHNYFEDRTMVYSLDYDAKNCRMNGDKPIQVYFVDTQSGAPVSGFSTYNQRFFSPRYLEVMPAGLSFQFRALNEVGQKNNRNYYINVDLVKSGNQCQVVTEFASGNSILVRGLQRVEMEFILEEQPLIGLQPTDILWVKLFGQTRTCLYGKCP